MTIQFVNYDPADGRIIQSGQCPDMDCLPVGPDGSAWLYDQMTRDVEYTRVIDGAIVPYTPPVTVEDVDAERDRRIALGFSFQSRIFKADMTNINGATATASAAILNGATDGDLRWVDTTRDFGWIAIDNTVLTMDARTTIMFGQTAMAFVSSLRIAARSIKDRILAGETFDIMDDSLWPSRTTNYIG